MPLLTQWSISQGKRTKNEILNDANAMHFIFFLKYVTYYLQYY